MADLLSKVKIGSTVYDLKDSDSRSKLTTLIGSNTLQALGTAAFKAVVTDISSTTGIADAATVKSYVDAQIGAIHNFDVVVCAADAAKIPAGAIYKDGATTITGTLAASNDTLWKLYLVKNSDAGAGAHIEYITVRSGSEGSYTYAWEQIGTTVIDLSNYVQKTQKICGIALSGDISTDDIKTALGLGALAYKDSASGTVSGQIISGVKATGTSTGEISVNLDQTSTDAVLTRGAYTPAGSITGTAISGGSVNVTLKDAASASEATVTKEDYTPVGNVSIAKDDNNGVQISGTVSKPDITVNVSAKAAFVQSLKAGDVDAASFTEGAFTAASYDAGFLSEGTQASFTQGAKASLTDQTTAKFVKKGTKFEYVNTTDDPETLVLSYVADTDTEFYTNAVTDRGSFTANGDDTFTANTLQILNASKFHGGSKEADTFTANKLPIVGNTSDALTGVSAALASAPTFTGDKFAATFTGQADQIKVSKVEYLQQVVNTSTFTGVNASLGFSGEEVANFAVTGVKYDKAVVNASTTKFTGKDIELTVGNISVASTDVTVS